MNDATATPPPVSQPDLLHERFLCIHGHFYQPPRENPWLETIDEQPTAAPFHDWNERVTAECYGPNTAARIVNDRGQIIDIRNNYEKISFNMGPTLLAWMEDHRPETYREILAADARSAELRGGHGNAIAQAYNHLIMPLASRRDKLTQVLWGMEDFRHRFRRDPEGMWLPETAVDTETLEVLAECGVKFTVLAPRQARAWRDSAQGGGWHRADHGSIDPSRPYVCALPSGRSIVLFFYDGPISQAVAFEGLLVNGDRFANRLLMGFNGSRTWPQLVHIATDGESYGHHHRHGEMALAYAAQVVESRGLARLTNYAEYLSLAPPTAEAQIWERSSWSCIHGVERWRADCGCRTGLRPAWHQRWRAPLRDAYDLLKKRADALFENAGGALFTDPWAARNDYIQVIHNKGTDATGPFLQRHMRTPNPGMLAQEALHLLEIQRNSMLMYTSCAWFFDDIAGIETVQTMRYAARLLQLIRGHEPNLEHEFTQVLAAAHGNTTEDPDGAALWNGVVRQQVVDLPRVMANYALLNFDRFFEGTRHHYCFRISETGAHLAAYGDWSLKLSRIGAVALFGGWHMNATVAVLHLGGHDFVGRIGVPLDDADYDLLHRELFNTFHRRSVAEVVRALDRHFGGRDYTLPDLFPESQRELLARVTRTGVERFESTLVLMFDENRKLMEYLRGAGAPLPAGFVAVAEYVLRARLKNELEKFMQSPESSQAMIVAQDARSIGLRIVDAPLSGLLSRVVGQAFAELGLAPTGGSCRVATHLLDIVETLGVSLDLWEAQNIVFALMSGRPLPSHLAAQSRYARRLGAQPFPALRQLAERLRISDEPLVAGHAARPQIEPEQRGAKVS